MDKRFSLIRGETGVPFQWTNTRHIFFKYRFLGKMDNWNVNNCVRSKSWRESWLRDGEEEKKYVHKNGESDRIVS